MVIVLLVTSVTPPEVMGIPRLLNWQMFDGHVVVSVMSDGSWPNRIVRAPAATTYVVDVSVTVTVVRRVTASCHPASRSRVVDRAQPLICSPLTFFWNPRTAPASKMPASASTTAISMPVYPSSRRPASMVARKEFVLMALHIPPDALPKIAPPSGFAPDVVYAQSATISDMDMGGLRSGTGPVSGALQCRGAYLTGFLEFGSNLLNIRTQDRR